MAAFRVGQKVQVDRRHWCRALAVGTIIGIDPTRKADCHVAFTNVSIGFNGGRELYIDRLQLRPYEPKSGTVTKSKRKKQSISGDDVSGE